MTKQKRNIHILLDFFAAIIVWLLFYLYRRVTADFIMYGHVDVSLIDPSYPLLLSVSFYVAAAMLIHYLSGYYSLENSPSRVKELSNTLTDSFFVALVVFFVLLIDDKVTSYSTYYQFLILLWGLQFVVTYLLRLLVTSIYFYRYRKGFNANNTLIVGTGTTALAAVKSMQHKLRCYGTNIKGFISIDSEHAVDSECILGNLSQLEQIIGQHNIHTVLLALDDNQHHLIYPLINRLLPLKVMIQSVPGQMEYITGKVKLIDVDSEPFVSLSAPSMRSWEISVKRLFDIIVSILALIILFPFLLVIALCIKISDNGPLFYRQERIGKNGKPFLIYKFRSMSVQAEVNGPQLSSINDPRITKIGTWLRRYRFDEIPQFFNVIKGDMSIVGPRPERLFFIEQISRLAPYYCLIYKIKPGLLSWGPIKVGYSDSIEKMVKRLNYDIVYMQNMSLLTDLKIILYSIQVVLSGKGV